MLLKGECGDSCLKIKNSFSIDQYMHNMNPLHRTSSLHNRFRICRLNKLKLHASEHLQHIIVTGYLILTG